MGKSVENDLTKGNVGTQLVRYAIPLVMTSFMQSLYSLVDILIAGNFIGSNGISAINNSSQVILIITKIAMGITQGGNIIIGQYFGASEEQKKKDAVGTLTILSLFLGIISMIVFYMGAEWMLIKLKAPALEEAMAYLQICAIGLGFVWLYNALSGILRAMGNSRMPMQCIMISTCVNIVLDLVFVAVLSMGTRGAALATIISQAVSCIVAMIFIIYHRESFCFTLDCMKIKAEQVKLIFRLGIPSALQMTIAGISWLFVTYLINQYGVDVSAGNGVSIKIKDICQLFLNAMSLATSTMVAQNLGAKKYDRVMEIVHTAIRISLIMAVVTIIACQFFAPFMVGFFTDNTAATAAASLNLRIEIFGQIFYAIFLIYNALAIGAGQAEFAMFNSFMNCIVIRVVLCYLFDHIWGVTGIYAACMIATSISVPIGWWYARSKKWKRNILTK
ncbi:MAG: MATE family efflux transporter [Lachnospiraceae bacterium]|nr:MATE family efflux transporter [Lachnospiraceae bacterium]